MESVTHTTSKLEGPRFVWPDLHKTEITCPQTRVLQIHIHRLQPNQVTQYPHPLDRKIDTRL